jgi:hypothetical protein
MARARELMSAGMPASQAQAILGRPQSLVLAGSTAADAAKITASKVPS